MLSEQLAGQDTTTAIAIASGARGNISQMKNAVGILGVFQDATGRAIELPVKSGYVKGLDPLEYFTGTRGTRKALIDIALKTADAGYLTRRLVDVAQDVVILDEDCGTLRGIATSALKDNEDVIEPLLDRIVGRTSLHNVFNPVNDEIIVESRCRNNR